MGVPEIIDRFLTDNHVLSLGVVDGEGPWAASLFYAYEPENVALLVMTSSDSRHGQALIDQKKIAGTVAGQPEHLRDIAGIQFTATVELLKETERSSALTRYRQRHAAARLMNSDIWRLELLTVKYTDNRLAFARKNHWQREAVSEA